MPPKYAPQMGFIDKHDARIEALRLAHWGAGRNGKGQHSSRWTGRDLAADVTEAAEHEPACEFDEIYATRYHQLCWDTHGSGLAGVRGLTEEQFPALIAIAFGEAARLGVLIGEQVLRLVRAWGDEVARAFEVHRATRILSKAESLGSARVL